MFSLLMPGCTTPPPASQTPQERFQRDTAFGVELSRNLEQNLTIREDPEVTQYLNGVAQQLAATLPELRLSPVLVKTIQNRGEKSSNYSLPGNRIYLSIPLMKGLGFDNEIAAAIALELGHISRRHALQYFRKDSRPTGVKTSQFDDLVLPQPGTLPEKVDYFSPSGVFAYSEAALTSAVESAVNMLFASGHDPRGLVSYFRYLAAQPAISPYDPSTLNKLMERARRMIALQPPLRNPIVRSQAFLSIQKRMQQL